MAIIKLSKAERRRISAFVTCFAFAMMAWIFVTLSNNYIFPVKVALSFKNQPLKKAFYALQADTVTAVVGGTGWQKLFSNIISKNRTVSIDLRKLETQNFIVLSNQLAQINQRTDKNQIVSFFPDTIYFDFATRKVKRVPISLKLKIDYQKQFARSGDIVLDPQFVTISGPVGYIDSITSWKTDSLTLNKVNQSIVTKLKLVQPKENNITIYPRTVDLNIPVDEFTEKTLEVPIKLINNRLYSRVTLFPKKVKITFLVSLSNYPEVNMDFFEATADLDAWQKQGLSMLPVKLKQQPDYCNIISVEPATINFIVRK